MLRVGVGASVGARIRAGVEIKASIGFQMAFMMMCTHLSFGVEARIRAEVEIKASIGVQMAVMMMCTHLSFCWPRSTHAWCARSASRLASSTRYRAPWTEW